MYFFFLFVAMLSPCGWIGCLAGHSEGLSYTDASRKIESTRIIFSAVQSFSPKSIPAFGDSHMVSILFLFPVCLVFPFQPLNPRHPFKGPPWHIVNSLDTPSHLMFFFFFLYIPCYLHRRFSLEVFIYICLISILSLLVSSSQSSPVSPGLIFLIYIQYIKKKTTAVSPSYTCSLLFLLM